MFHFKYRNEWSRNENTFSKIKLKLEFNFRFHLIVTRMRREPERVSFARHLDRII